MYLIGAFVSPVFGSIIPVLGSVVSVLGSVVPVLGVGLMFAIVAVVCMRRRSFVDWSDDERKCSAMATNVSSNVTSDCSTP